MALSLELLAKRSDEFDRAVLSRDRALAADVLTDDFALVLLHPAPAVVSRSAWIEMLPDYVVHAWKVEEQKIEVRDAVGLVFQRVHMDATVLGQDRSGLFVISDLWVPVDDVWRIWRRQSTPLSAGRMPASAD